MSEIELSRTQEAEIKSSFEVHVEFHYTSNVSHLEKLLSHIKKSSGKDIDFSSRDFINENIFGELMGKKE